MGKIILIVVYVILIASSGYNLYSFKPDVGFGVKLEKGISQSLQNYISIRNLSDLDFKNIDVMVDDKYYLHIYHIESKNSYNTFPTQFLEIDVRPNHSSRVLIEREKKINQILDENNKIFNEKVDFNVFKGGQHYNQKL